MLRLITVLCFIFSIQSLGLSQKDTMPKELPFHTIDDYPDTLTAATILARSIEGLGFRYYWATEGLTLADYDYSAGNGNRSVREVLEHVLDLSDMVHNVVLGIPNIRPRPRTKKSDYVRRRTTLNNLWKAVSYLRDHPELDLASRPIVYQRGETVSEMPNWHLYNGPLADALWHCGQIVSHRRAAGNPIPDGVNVFMGSKE